MSDLPDPPPMSTPYGAPGSGYQGARGPFGPVSSGGNQRLIVFALLGLAVLLLGALVVVLIGGGGGDDDADPGVVATEPSVDASGPVVTEAPVTAAPPATEAPAVTEVPVTVAPATTAAQVTAPPAPVSPLTGGSLPAIVDEVAAARGADPLRLLRLVVYPEYLFAQVQDPTIPANIDEYSWRRTLEAPTPVRLPTTDGLEERLYSADEVDWAAIPALVTAARDAVGIADGEVTHVIIERPLPFSTDVRMRAFVRGERTDGYVDADASGVIFAVNGS